MQTELPLDPTRSLYHILSVTHEMRGRKMDAASPHSQSHLGPWMSPYLQLQPPSNTWGDAKALPHPLKKVGHRFPRENVSSSKCPLLVWAAVSLKVRLTFKGFGPLTVGAGMVGTVGKLWLGHRLCSSRGRYGSASEIRPSWQSHCCRSSHRKWGVANKPFQQFPWSKKSDMAKF